MTWASQTDLQKSGGTDGEMCPGHAVHVFSVPVPAVLGVYWKIVVVPD